MDKNNEFEKNGVSAFSILMLGNILGAMFQILSGRILNNLKMYGDLNTLLSVYTLTIWPTTVITFIVARYVALYNNVVFIKNLYRKMLRFSGGLAICVVLVGGLNLRVLTETFNISGNLVWLFLILYASSAFFLAVIGGMFQGLKKFIAYGCILLAGQATKIIAMLISIYFSYKLEIIFGIIFLGGIFTILGSHCYLRHMLGPFVKTESDIELKYIVKYSITVIIANCIIAFISNIDILFVKIFFENEAGEYSVATVLGKSIMYFSGAIVVVLFPMAVNAKDDTKKNQELLRKSINYNLMLATIAAFLLNIFACPIIKILYGDIYLKSIVFILPVTLMIIPISLITVIINYILAINKYYFILYFMVVIILIEIITIYFFHDNVIKSIHILGMYMWFILILSTLFLKIKINQEKRVKNVKNNKFS